MDFSPFRCCRFNELVLAKTYPLAKTQSISYLTSIHLLLRNGNFEENLENEKIRNRCGNVWRFGF